MTASDESRLFESCAPGLCPRDRIVVAARHLFSARGFHQTSIADLAAEAHVSVGAIYRSFDNKSAIILAIVDEDMSNLMAGLEVWMEQIRTAKVAIQYALEQMLLEQMERHDEMLSHEVLAEGHRNPAVKELVKSFSTQMRGIFREFALTANPDIQGDHLVGAEDLMFASLIGLAHRELVECPIECTRLAQVASEMLLKALRN